MTAHTPDGVGTHRRERKRGMIRALMCWWLGHDFEHDRFGMVRKPAHCVRCDWWLV